MKSIHIKPFLHRWYLVWTDTNQTICSFATEFEAYAARRAMLNKTNNISYNYTCED
jgi:hypothetical protein